MRSTNELKFSVKNWPVQHMLASLELWSPGQGAVREMLPLDLELRFDCERIRTPNQDIQVKLKRAEIAVVLNGLSVVRGSRFGDEINEPYELYEIIDASKAQLETETERKGSVSFSISRDVFGRIFATIGGRRRTSKSAELDRIGKSAVKKYRVTARNGDRWTVMEPRPPFVLSGRVLGIRSDSEKSDPLCLLELRRTPAAASVFIFADKNDVLFDFKPNSGRLLSRNKEIVASMLARRAIQHSQINITGSAPVSEGGILLCYSELSCKSDNENR